MKNNLKKCIFILLFLLILIGINVYAANVTISSKQEHRQDAYITVKSTEQMNSVKIYKKTEGDKYILFYKSNPQKAEIVCRISAKLLSDEKATEFKVVVEHNNNEVVVQNVTIDKIEKVVEINPSETAKPSFSPTPVPTKPTPSESASTSPSPSTSPSTSSTETPSESPSGSPSESPSSSTPASETPAKGEHKYSTTGSKIDSYKDETISVSLEKIGNFYVTKVWVKDPSKQMKKASGDWGKTLKQVKTMLNGADKAIVGCNGSGFYLKGSWEPGSAAIKKTSWNKTTEGNLVITNGTILRQLSGLKTNALLGILPSGGFKYYEANAYKDVINDGVKNTFTFGPMLIYNGKNYKQQTGSPRFSSMTSKAHRCCIGQIDENNYVILSTKVTSSLNECAAMGKKLDCQMLYNLDGGGSTTLWFRKATSGTGKELKTTGRSVGDALYFTTQK